MKIKEQLSKLMLTNLIYYSTNTYIYIYISFVYIYVHTLNDYTILRSYYILLQNNMFNSNCFKQNNYY